MKRLIIGIFLLCVLMFGCKSNYSIEKHNVTIINKQIYITTSYVREVKYLVFVDVGDGVEINAINSELLYRTLEIGDILLLERKKCIKKGKFGNNGVYILGWDYIE